MGVYTGIAKDNVTINSGNARLDSMGYTNATFGTVTQATNKSTAVTLDTMTGRITMNDASLGNNASANFDLNNSNIGVNDVVVVNIAGGGTAGAYLAGVCCLSEGVAKIKLINLSGGALAEPVQILFTVIKVG